MIYAFRKCWKWFLSKPFQINWARSCKFVPHLGTNFMQILGIVQRLLVSDVPHRSSIAWMVFFVTFLEAFCPENLRCLSFYNVQSMHSLFFFPSGINIIEIRECQCSMYCIWLVLLASEVFSLSCLKCLRFLLLDTLS